MDHDRYLIGVETEGRGNARVVDLGNILQFGEMIPGPERSELWLATGVRSIGHKVGVGSRKASAFLDTLEIVPRPEPAIDGPRGAALKYIAEFLT